MVLILFALLGFLAPEAHVQDEHLLVLQSNSTGAMIVNVHCTDINDKPVTLEYFLEVAGEDCHALENIKKITSVSAIFTDADHLSDSIVLKKARIEESEFTGGICSGNIKTVFEYKYGRSVRSSMSIRATELY